MRPSYLRHVMDALSDAHQNVLDQAMLIDGRELTQTETELLNLIDAAFLFAQHMRIQDVASTSV